MKSPENIDAYIEGCPKEFQAKLGKLRAVIRRAMPKAEETISYGMPAFNLNGCRVYFAAWKNHIGFYPLSTAAKIAFREELGSCKVEKSTIRFPIGKPLPLDLISRIVEFEVREKLAKSNSEFPKIPAPAARALKNAKIETLKDLSKWSETEILALHGMGPSSLPKLREALRAKGLSFEK